MADRSINIDVLAGRPALVVGLSFITGLPLSAVASVSRSRGIFSSEPQRFN
jgi:hypothetical protein